MCVNKSVIFCASGVRVFELGLAFRQSTRAFPEGNTKNVSIHGQEGTTTALKLARMNLAIRGILTNLGVKADDTFASDQHPDLDDGCLRSPPHGHYNAEAGQKGGYAFFRKATQAWCGAA
uniref:N-6 DNA Methylase n=1 Tax=Candidatus Kentrum sp. FW TaxID=2126338 RepID=A0A450TR06_9GAMM|nr:MAG: N-6 DNA Methylase [Candidatus Kentron sp. FW]